MHVAPDGEIKVNCDGLFKGYIRKALPGQGGGWFWRSHRGPFGEARTKDQAVDAVCNARNAQPGAGA